MILKIKLKRGRDDDAYYRSHHEIDTVIGHSLGGAVSLALEKQYKKEGNNPYGIIPSKTFGAPVVSRNIGSSFGKVGKSMVKNSILYLGVAGEVYADSVIGFADGSLITKLSADIANDMSTRLT